MSTESFARSAAATTAAAFVAVALQAAARAGSDGLLHVLVGDAPGDRFGAALAGIGDVDGDGCADFVVGAPQADPNGTSSGIARVFSGRDGRVLCTFAGDSAFDSLGAAVAGAGDVDGDGTPDVLVGAPRGEPAAGSAQVYSGRSGALLMTFSGAGAGERFGQSVCGIGDADGDGRGDLAIGAPLSDAVGESSGRVELRSGATGALLFALHGEPFDRFGTSLAAAGDLDGDGRADVLIGAPLSDAGAFNAGSARVHSGRDGSLIAAFHGAGAGDQLGQWVAGAGDVDGDGRPDVLLGIPGADANGIDSGAAELRSGATGALLLRVAGSEEGAYLGTVAGLGDVDADGRPDLALGAASTPALGPESGSALLVRGPPGSPAAALFGRGAYDWFGASLAGVGDADGDGWPDLAIGAPAHDDVLTKPGYVQVYSGRWLAGAP